MLAPGDVGAVVVCVSLFILLLLGRAVAFTGPPPPQTGTGFGSFEFDVSTVFSGGGGCWGCRFPSLFGGARRQSGKGHCF